MAWTNPAIRSTGDLITATMWNDEIINNLLHLYGRQGHLTVPPLPGGGSWTPITGPWLPVRLDNTSASSSSYANFPFVLPADFDTLESATIYLFGDTTGLYEYDLLSRYSTPDVDAYNANAETVLNANLGLTVGIVTSVDASVVLTGAAANDVVSVTFRTSGGALAADMLVLSMDIRYTRT